MFRNRWPECSGMGGRDGAELVAGIKRNMQVDKVRKNYSASFKAKVALEAVKKEKTIQVIPGYR